MKIALLGSGNIANFLAKNLNQKHQFVQVYSRTEAHGMQLANQLNCAYIANLSDLTQEADIYILAIKDDALERVIAQLKIPANSMVVHCAGAKDWTILNGVSNHIGVLWVLYSIRKEQLPAHRKVPLMLDTNSDATYQKLVELASDISEMHSRVNYTQRQYLHLNAVLVNNFTNHLYAIAQNLCKEQNLAFSNLLPIIEQTVQQLHHRPAADLQTGPAIRRDDSTIDKHLELLTQHPIWSQVYQQLTTSIQATNPESQVED
jgi:predicted short-subunit dehydrogenase-like oxidoreductase (DUF2520 family)